LYQLAQSVPITVKDYASVMRLVAKNREFGSRQQHQTFIKKRLQKFDQLVFGKEEEN
jgi:hypothetical protein